MQYLKLQAQHGVGTVTLARPELRNAFDEHSIAEIRAAFLQFDADPKVRCIVLAAEGSAFCAGADLHWMRRMAQYNHQENLHDASLLANMLATIDQCSKPTIAQVQGDAYAGGLGLVAACDLAVGLHSAGFCLSEVKLGLIPATISPYLIRAIGARAAHRYFLTAERFAADEALRLGLLHQVADTPAALEQAVALWCKHLLQASPNALRECKRLLRQVVGCPIDAQLIDQTVQGIADIRASAEGQEGILSFLEKRRPHWVK